MRTRFLLMTLSTLLAACGVGGSGGSSNPPANEAPTVSIAAPETEAIELSTVVLVANASDPDGDALSYSWTQTDGATVDISGADSEEISFTLPKLDGPGTLSFSVTVDDGHQHMASANVDVTTRQGEFVVISAAIDNPGSYEMFRVHEAEGQPVRLAAARADADAGNPTLRYRGNITSGQQISPDGSKVMWVDSVVAGGPAVLHVADIFGDGQARALEAQPNPKSDTASWSPDGSMIAFVKHVPDEGDALFVVPAESTDGSDARKISGDISYSDGNPDNGAFDARIWEYAWSPNSQQMAFRGQIEDGFSALYLAGTATAAAPRRRITQSWGVYYSWSPDGSSLIFLDDYQGGYLDLSMVPADTIDGSDKVTLIDQADALIRNYPQNFPLFSPDGSHIAIGAAPTDSTQKRSLYMISTDGAGLREVSPPTIHSNALQDYSWSPDGQFIAMQGWFESNLKNELYVTMQDAVDGSSARKVSGSGMQDFVAYAWSPDSSQLAFTAYLDSGAATQRLFLVDADGFGSDRREVSGELVDADGDGAIDSTFGYIAWARDGSALYSFGDLNGDGLDDVFRVPSDSTDGSERHSFTGFDDTGIDVKLMYIGGPGL